MFRFPTHHEGIVWSGALCCAVTAHIALLAACCGQAFFSDVAYSPAMAIMLSFAETPARPDISAASDKLLLSALQAAAPDAGMKRPAAVKAAPPVPAERDLSPPQPIAKKTVQNKTEHAKPAEKVKAAQRKRQKAAAEQISAPVSSRFSGAHNSQTVESHGQAAIKWLAKIQSHLERQKNYLRNRSSAYPAGTVQLTFSVAENGAVEAPRPVQPAGSPELEQLALNILKRASPLPRPPGDMAGKNIIIPLVFR